MPSSAAPRWLFLIAAALLSALPPAHSADAFAKYQFVMKVQSAAMANVNQQNKGLPMIRLLDVDGRIMRLDPAWVRVDLAFDEMRYSFDDKQVDTPELKYPVGIDVTLPKAAVLGGFKLENADFGNAPVSWTLAASNDVRDREGMEIWTTIHEQSSAANLGRVSQIYQIA